MTKNKLLKWVIAVVLITGATATVYVLATPTFSNDYKQLTERVEVGMKYTNPDEQTAYFHPYIENPNSSSDLTLTHTKNFIKIYVLDDRGNVLEDCVTVKENNKDTEGKLQTTLAPGEQEQNSNYYRIDFPEEADRLQLTFEGEVEDEFGLDQIEEAIEVDIAYLNI